MPTKEIFENFIVWQKQQGIDIPETEHLLPMLEAYYSPEEAEFLTGFPVGWKTLEAIAEIKEIDAAELALKLKELCEKGMVIQSFRKDMVRYRLADLLFTFMRGRLWVGNEEGPMKNAAPSMNKYFTAFFDQFKHDSERGLRTLPIQETIEPGTQVLPFEDVVKYIDDREVYTVSDCPCRTRYEMDPDYQDCDHPMNVCLHFDDLGRYCLENGLGREITRDETLAILKQSADSGLVHGISNWEETPDTI